MKWLRVVLLWICSGAAWGDTREVVMVVDTSGSMSGNDEKRYTAHFAKILADLMDDTDALSLEIVPNHLFAKSCGASNPASHSFKLGALGRSGFKSGVDGAIEYGSSDTYPPAMNPAVSRLKSSKADKKMLIVIGDQLGWNGYRSPCGSRLGELKGTSRVWVRLGGGSGKLGFDDVYDAHSNKKLLEALGKAYQKLNDLDDLTVHQSSGSIGSEVGPFVKRAFIVVTADGAVGSLAESGSNPDSDGVDLNYRKGGTTKGEDGTNRQYRIIKIDSPKEGQWSFQASGGSSDLAYMLIQEFSLSLEVEDNEPVATGDETTVIVHVIDETTGGPADLSRLPPGYTVKSKAAGADSTCTEVAGKLGQLSCLHTFSTEGTHPVKVTLEVPKWKLERTQVGSVEAVEIRCAIEALDPGSVQVGDSVELQAQLEFEADAIGPKWPSQVTVDVNGESVQLAPAGTPSGLGPHLYRGTWKAETLGAVSLSYRTEDGSICEGDTDSFEILPFLDLGDGVLMDFRHPEVDGCEEESDRCSTATLDLQSAVVKGDFEIELVPDFDVRDARVQIWQGEGADAEWREIDGAIRIPLRADGPRTWEISVAVDDCCTGEIGRDQLWSFEVRPVQLPEGMDAVDPLTVPAVIQIQPDSWLRCWWNVIVLSLLGLLGFMTVTGFISPSRFNRRLAVVIYSDPEDEDDGSRYGVRQHRGTRHGFYRDAVSYLCGDYALRGHVLSGLPTAALLRIRAQGRLVRILPIPGTKIEWENADGEWEALPEERESVAGSGRMYRVAGRDDFYFEFRL